MEISSLILPFLFRQCSHQVMNRAVLSKDARVRAQDSITARTPKAWPSPTWQTSQHLSVLACIFKNRTQISFIFFLAFVLLQGINCSIMWAPAFALCSAWLPHRLVNVSLHLAQGQRGVKGLTFPLPTFLCSNIHLLFHQQKILWSPALQEGLAQPHSEVLCRRTQDSLSPRGRGYAPKAWCPRTGQLYVLTQGFCIIVYFVTNIWMVLETDWNHLLLLPAEYLKKTQNQGVLQRFWKFLIVVRMSLCLHAIYSGNLFFWNEFLKRSSVPRPTKNTNRLSVALDKSWGWLWHGLGLLWWLLGQQQQNYLPWFIFQSHYQRDISVIAPMKLGNYPAGHRQWKHRWGRTLQRQEHTVWHICVHGEEFPLLLLHPGSWKQLVWKVLCEVHEDSSVILIILPSTQPLIIEHI